MPVTLVCQHCGTEYQRTPSKAARSNFCTARCRYDARLKKTDAQYLGKRFGKLTVLSRCQDDSQQWLVRCECGTEKTVRIHAIVNGETVSCGCHRRDIGMRMFLRNRHAIEKPLNPGDQFGRWTIIEFLSCENGASKYLCKCECGTERDVFRTSLISGASQSCGCYHREISAKQAAKNFTTHGLYDTPEYKRYWRHRRNEADSDWTLEMERALFEFMPECVVCGSVDTLSLDHVIPVSKDGRAEPGNVVVLCKSCNSRKHDKDLSELPFEWALMIDYMAYQFLQEWAA